MAIRVIVLLDRHGTNTDVHHLGSLTIANDGTGSTTRRNYDVGQHAKGRSPHVVKTGRVIDFPSKNVSIWKLVATALASLGHDAQA